MTIPAADTLFAGSIPRFGRGAVDSKMQAHVVTVAR